MGVYVFLPFGLGPPPGWNDIRFKAVLDVARAQFPQLRIVDFVAISGLWAPRGERGALAPGVAG